VKRVTSAMSRVRPIQPRLRYTNPPPMERPDPRRLTASETTAIFASETPEAQLATVLTRRLRAISPQMAREIAFRVAGDVKVRLDGLGPDEWGAVARETRNLFEPLLTSAWSPRVYRDEEGAVVAFAAVEMRHLAADRTEEVVSTISRAAELAGGSDEATPARHSQRRERLLQAIRLARARTETRLASLRTEGAKAKEADRLREWGELIYGYLWGIAPGQKELVVDGVTVPLDPAMSAKENAQAYFERYRKAQSAGSHVPELVEKAEQEVAYLEQLTTLVSQAERFDDLEALAVEWDAYLRASGRAGGDRKPVKRSAPPRRPRAIHDEAGNAIYVGRSGSENDAVTFDVAGPNDTWLHARGVPGSHVIVRWHDPAGIEDEESLRRAAALAAYYSSARSSGTVEVDATRRRYVRKIKGSGPGMVTYRNERTLAVRPMDEAALALAALGRR
jgi:predicted ribosome quality control (RQC) complex YloA/Tae2 family protein